MKEQALRAIEENRHLVHIDNKKYLVKLSDKVRNHYIIVDLIERTFQFFTREKLAVQAFAS